MGWAWRYCSTAARISAPPSRRPLLPIAAEQDGQLAELVSAADFASIDELQQLMAVVAQRLPGAAGSA